MHVLDGVFYKLVSETDNVPDRNIFPHLLKQICSAYGLKTAAYFGINVRKINPSEPYLAVTYSSDWVEHYRSMNYVKLDPIIRSGFSELLPIDWNGEDARSKKLRDFFGEASEFGIGRRGLTFPIRGRSGDRALFTVTSDVSCADWRASLLHLERDLQMLAYHLHQRVLVIEGADRQPVKLAPREIECLRWISDGKTHWETSVILGISKKTVDFYLENARVKLGAANSQHAAMKASHQNLLLIPS